MNYTQTMEYLESLKQYGVVPGLDNMVELCRRLGNPQEQLRVLHIAGTNGKGSVLAYLSTALQQAGYKVGRYISPVIFEYREKIQCNRHPISQKKLCDLVGEVKDICDSMVADGKPHPTQFEVETAMAFSHFAKEKCDFVVLETGMGGRLDATNIISHPLVSIIASISMDHMKFLGNSLEAIATEKAGIIKQNCPVVAMTQENVVMDVLKRKAEQMGSTITFTEEQRVTKVRSSLTGQKFSCNGREDFSISLTGKYQVQNALLSITVLEQLEKMGITLDWKKIKKGFQDTTWPGRFQVVAKKPLVVLDGAHNEDAAKKLAESIRFYFTNRKIVYIMGVLKDKEYEKVIAETYVYAEHIITVTPPGQERALPGQILAETARGYHPYVTAAGSLEEAVEMAYLLTGKEDVILCFGTLSFLGRLTKLLEGKNGGRNGRQTKN